MSSEWLIYGAYGYTGRLIAERALQAGHRPILAGRDRERTEKLAAELSLPSRVFGLDNAPEVARGLDGVAAVIHAAGPFVRTWRPMARACLETGAHYLDVTGEIDVFEGLRGLDAEAAQRRIALLPGVGFDVVPTDCAAAQVAAALDDPVRLDLAFHARGGASRGTMRTAVEALGGPGKARRDGRIVDVPMGSLQRSIPFSDRVREGVAIPWGDVSTAWHSTGIPNITVYQTGLGERVRQLQRFGWLLRRRTVRSALQWWIGRTVTGPNAQQRARGQMRVWAEASNAAGRSATVELTCPDGYAFTADAAVTSVQEILGHTSERPRAGFLTPSIAFGADFVYRLDGVRRVEAP